MPRAISITRPTFTDVDSLPAAAFDAVAISSAVVPDADGASEGVIRLAGDLTGTAAAPALAASGATPGAYGDAGANIPSITVDAKGRITLVSNRALGYGDVGAAAASHGHAVGDITGLGAMALNTLSVQSSTAVNITQTGGVGAAMQYVAVGAPQVNLTAGKWLVIGTVPVRESTGTDTDAKLEFSDVAGANAFGAGSAGVITSTTRKACTVVGTKTVASGTFSVFFKGKPDNPASALDFGAVGATAFAGTLLAIRLEGP